MLATVGANQLEEFFFEAVGADSDGRKRVFVAGNLVCCRVVVLLGRVGFGFYYCFSSLFHGF